MALFGNIVLCDYAYVDRESSKAVLAGVFSGDILLPSLPARLRVSLYSEFLPPESGKHRIEIRIFLDKKLFARAESEVANTISGTPTIIILPQIEIGIDRPLTLRIKASVNGGRETTLVTKRIMVKEKPSTLVPPA